MRAAACGTNAGLERWAEALLPPSLTQSTAQVGTLWSLNITFSGGLQLSPCPFFPIAVVGWLARKGERSAKGEMVSRQEPNHRSEASIMNPACSVSVRCRRYFRIESQSNLALSRCLKFVTIANNSGITQ